jgi:hypothetical protein
MFGTLLEILSPLFRALIGELVQGHKHSVLDSPDLKHFSRALTGRLVYLLRYMDENPDPRYPDSYARVLSGFVDIGKMRQPARYSVEAENAWVKAAQYACFYLSAFGLVQVCGGIGNEVSISDFGKRLVRTDEIRRTFRSAFQQPLP